MERVIIDFDENGNPLLRVEGAKGPICKEITAELEAALGPVTARRLTAEHNLKVRQIQEETNVTKRHNRS